MSPRDRILARRAKFMAAAMTSLMGCSDDAKMADPEPCLSVAYDAGPDDTARPQPCLTDTGPSDTGAADTSTDSSVTDGDRDADTGPTPCLVPPLDTGVGDATDTGPAPCLKMPFDSGTD